MFCSNIARYYDLYQKHNKTMLLNQILSTRGGYESPACTFITLTSQEIVCQSGTMQINDLESDGDSNTYLF